MKCIVSLGGDYAAFHEISMSVVYVLGSNEEPSEEFGDWFDK